MHLRVGQIVDSTEAEGPGRRFAVWTQGCTLRCTGCCNPHLFSERGGTEVDVSALLTRIAATAGIEGVTVIGGEPFEQPAALAELARGVQALGLSVMVFSGYTRAELEARGASLTGIDILVDGRFDEGRIDDQRRWVGSTNQQLHFLTERGRADAPRFAGARTVEIRLTKGALSVNGWPTAEKVVGR
jgi:anaerobic ribonucleoside-triphosphate reductase activating protein